MIRPQVRRALPPFLVVLLCALCQWGCDAQSGAHALEAAHGDSAGSHGGHKTGEFLSTSPLTTETVVTSDFVCQIHAIQRIEVRALEGGYLDEVFVDEGQRVKAGDPLFQIMPKVYEAELGRAKAEVQVAAIEYANTELLAKKDVVSPNELALAKANLGKAQAELALRQAHLSLTKIRAPFDGIVGLLEARSGSLLEEGELLSTLSDNSQMWVYFNVTESEYLDYMARPAGSSSAEVRLSLANGHVFEESGTISTIEADFNNETGTIAFRATFSNPGNLLRHGETGTIHMTRPLKDAVLIPQSATFEILDQRYVFVVDEHKVVHQRRVTIAEELPHLFVVASGLKGDEKILLEGLRKVRDGSVVEIRYQAPAQAFGDLDLPAE